MNTLIKNLLFSRKWQIFRHILFWVFIYLDEALSFIGITEAFDEYYTMGISLLLDMLFIYFNLYFLFPRFLKKRKFAEYLGYTVASLLVLVLGESAVEMIFFDGESLSVEFFVSIIVLTSVTLSTALAVKVLKTSIVENQLREAAEKEKLSFELQNLKKQVNPHFLFNILNGIYIQSQTDHEAVPQTIMQLSDLLRYQIYDAEKNDKVFLSQEIEFIENYIALEQIRRDNTEVNLSVECSDKSFKIEPLIFLTLVENAFKYSVPASGEKSIININLEQKYNDIRFQIDNTIGILSNESGGFGLENLKKRLEIIYPDQHSLLVDVSKDGIFSAKLVISTNERNNSR